MSDTRCDHGVVVVDRTGIETRCLKCDPLDGDEVDSLKERIQYLENIVSDLCERNGMNFNP